MEPDRTENGWDVLTEEERKWAEVFSAAGRVAMDRAGGTIKKAS